MFLSPPHCPLEARVLPSRRPTRHSRPGHDTAAGSEAESHREEGTRQCHVSTRQVVSKQSPGEHRVGGLGRKRSMMPAVSEAKAHVFIARMLFLRLTGPRLLAKGQSPDTEKTRFHINAAPKRLRTLGRKRYGSSSIKQHLSKRHLEYQFSRKKKEESHNQYGSPESPQSFNISPRLRISGLYTPFHK